MSKKKQQSKPLSLEQFQRKGAYVITENMGEHQKVPNLGWLFYKDYYFSSRTAEFLVGNSKIEDELKEKNGKILNFSYSSNTKKIAEDILRLNSVISNYKELTFKTTYPGLIIGSGISHETGKDSVGEFKLGFFFDYTTGLPIIPGTSIKGVLRSVWPYKRRLHLEKKKKYNEKDKEDLISWGKYIIDLLDKIAPQHKVTIENIEELEKEIFEGEINGKPKPLSKRDAFYEAIIIGKVDEKNQKILGKDSITPHGKNPMKNPIPLLFLKVLPNVKFCFQFKLFKSVEFNITADQKLELFESIIEDWGIGAKTNVNYGTLEKLG